MGRRNHVRESPSGGHVSVWPILAFLVALLLCASFAHYRKTKRAHAAIVKLHPYQTMIPDWMDNVHIVAVISDSASEDEQTSLVTAAEQSIVPNIKNNASAVLLYFPLNTDTYSPKVSHSIKETTIESCNQWRKVLVAPASQRSDQLSVTIRQYVSCFNDLSRLQGSKLSRGPNVSIVLPEHLYSILPVISWSLGLSPTIDVATTIIIPNTSRREVNLDDVQHLRRWEEIKNGIESSEQWAALVMLELVK